MALDGIFLSLLKQEFLPLIGSRVDKIHQPSREELIISMRTKEGAKRLLFNISAQSARVQLTNVDIENPKSPPMFCMLMRKRLSGGKLTAVTQDGFERILELRFETLNEMGDPAVVTLHAEIMGRCSNLIVTESKDGEEKIVDSLKRVTPDMSGVRPVMPGMVYSPPPRSEKLTIFTADRHALSQQLAAVGQLKLPKALVRVIEGVSPVFAREAEFYACKGGDAAAGELTDDMLDRLAFFLKKTAAEISSGKPRFTAVYTKDGSLSEYCFCDICQYGTLGLKKYYDSASELLDSFYSRKDLSARIKQKASDLFRVILAASERVARRTANQKQELKDCADKERLKLCGDLIMSNLYRLEKGMTSAKLENYFQPDCPTVEIALDARLTPAQNAQKYYSQYRKLSTAEKRLQELISFGEQELDYIDSVFDLLSRASTEGEIAELRAELAEQGYVKSPRYKGKPPKAEPPARFLSDDGFVILVGRNNKQNDKLTLKDSDKSDIWLHTKNIHGSHVIICCEGRPVPESTLIQAAQLAAYHSKGRDSAQVPVDYTQVRFVKKPAGAKPGMVIFTNNKTLFVTPDEELTARLRAAAERR